MRWEDCPSREPGPLEVRIRHTAVGLNFIDVYERTGLYPGPLPTGLGHEAAGVVEAVGTGVRGLMPGARVAYAVPARGAYADECTIAADLPVPVPDGVSDRLAAAALLKGMTAQVLLRRVHRVRRGSVVVIHSATGGVGSIAVQWARHLGAKVIGVVGSEGKVEAARAFGCHHVLVQGEDLPARVREIAGRRGGADVVYDAVGKDTFFLSLDCLRPLGLMVSYGNASGPVPPIAPLELSKRGSLYLTRPTLFTYVAQRTELLRSAAELFDVIGRGIVRVEIGQTYPLREVQRAHRELEARRTVGSTVLLP
jgi:NADPH2:quinone reductase